MESKNFANLLRKRLTEEMEIILNEEIIPQLTKRLHDRMIDVATLVSSLIEIKIDGQEINIKLNLGEKHGI